MKTVGFIGLGFMGEALLRSMLQASPATNFFAIDAQPGRIEAVSKNLPVQPWQGTTLEMCNSCELIVLAIKPQNLAMLFSQPLSSSPMVLSILAGTSLQRLSETFPQSHIARCMPNLAFEFGKAATGMTFSADFPVSQRQSLQNLLIAGGLVIELPEHLFSALIGISGSGIAYALRFARALAMAGVHEGLQYATSLEITALTLEGAAALIRSGVDPEIAITRVCSPGGTTIRGLKALEKNNFSNTVMEAAIAASTRNQEFES